MHSEPPHASRRTPAAHFADAKVGKAEDINNRVSKEGRSLLTKIMGTVRISRFRHLELCANAPD